MTEVCRIDHLRTKRARGAKTSNASYRQGDKPFITLLEICSLEVLAYELSQFVGQICLANAGPQPQGDRASGIDR